MPARDPERDAAWQRGIQGAGPYAGLAGQIAGALLFFVGGGAWLDHSQGTSPLWVLVGAVLSAVALGLILYRLVKETARTPRERPVKPAPPPDRDAATGPL